MLTQSSFASGLISKALRVFSFLALSDSIHSEPPGLGIDPTAHRCAIRDGVSARGINGSCGNLW